jgi:hypothetical protein
MDALDILSPREETGGAEAMPPILSVVKPGDVLSLLDWQ